MQLMQEDNLYFVTLSESFDLGTKISCIVVLLHIQSEESKVRAIPGVSLDLARGQEEKEHRFLPTVQGWQHPCISSPDKVEYLCFALRS